jgi:Fe2+ transport system protein FeoA
MSPTVSAQQCPTRLLSATTAGEVVRLVRIDAGRSLNSRLTAMGLVPDSEVMVVSNGHPGPFILIVKNTKVVLGRGAAQKITVR